MIDEPRPSWLPGLLVGSAVCFGGAWALDRACVAHAAPPVIEPLVGRPHVDASPALPHVELYAGPPGMCQPTSDRPWWWVDEAPTRLGVLLYDAPTEDERGLVERAIDGCAWTSRQVADPWLALALVRLDEDAGAPAGMLLAAWCREASMRTVSVRDGGPVRGDWHDGVADSVGPFQLQGWWLRWCPAWDRDERAELVPAAECYLARVVSALPKVAHCAEPWRVAEALAANGRRYAAQGCAARSKHWETLEGWR